MSYYFHLKKHFFFIFTSRHFVHYIVLFLSWFFSFFFFSIWFFDFSFIVLTHIIGMYSTRVQRQRVICRYGYESGECPSGRNIILNDDIVRVRGTAETARCLLLLVESTLCEMKITKYVAIVIYIYIYIHLWMVLFFFCMKVPFLLSPLYFYIFIFLKQ